MIRKWINLPLVFKVLIPVTLSSQTHPTPGRKENCLLANFRHSVMRSSLFWDIMQCRLVVCYSKSFWTAWPLRIGPTGCTWTFVTNYLSVLCNILYQHILKRKISHQVSGGTNTADTIKRQYYRMGRSVLPIMQHFRRA
jgi:hypothetical protein